MNLQLADKRVLEASTIKWCIDHPEEFGMVAGQMADYHIYYPPWKIVWGALKQVHKSHGQFPNLPECKGIIDRLTDYDVDTRAHLKSELDFLYSVQPTEVTGEQVREFVSQRELMEVSTLLASAVSSPNGEVQEEIRRAIRRLEDLSMTISKRGKTQTFKPLSPEGVTNYREHIKALYGGGDPLPFGLSRLDRRLKGGGIQAHISIIIGFSGGGKTTLALHTALHNVRRGKRVVYLALDDSPGELTERVFSHCLMEDVSEAAETWDPAYLDACIANEIRQMPGDFHGEALDPNSVAPEDIAGLLKMLQYRFIREDRAKGVPEELQGRIDAVMIDSGDQITDSVKAKSKDTWHNKRLTFEQLNIIPKVFGCPTVVTVQSGQEGVGASQITMRNAGESYGKIKPAKLVIGWAQTIMQRHEKRYIDFENQFVRDNLHNLENLDPENDRNTSWKPWWLCVTKNTRAREVEGPASWVKFPMLVDFSTCRIIEDYQNPEELILEDKKTKREEREADGTLPSQQPPSNSGKRGPK